MGSHGEGRKAGLTGPDSLGRLGEAPGLVGVQLRQGVDAAVCHVDVTVLECDKLS